jgi:hypothetical protein
LGEAERLRRDRTRRARRWAYSLLYRASDQTMVVRINASGETLCPLIFTTDRPTTSVFRNGTGEGVNLKIRIARSAHVDTAIFHGYLRDVLIPKTEEFREASVRVDEPAVFLMDNCSAHCPSSNSIGFPAPRESNYLPASYIWNFPSVGSGLCRCI